MQYTVSMSRQVVSHDARGDIVLREMPKLWTETIESHRREVRDAILDTTAALVAEHGVRSVTTSRIAEDTGIGRATLYKYFPDVETILYAWHDRQITGHLEELEEIRHRADGPLEALRGVLETYATITRESQGHHTELRAFLHRDQRLPRARDQLRHMLRDLLREAGAGGLVRDDVPPEQLATYCLHALAAAGDVPSKSAARRLVAIVLAGLRPV
jgi:AcrR family transcriptional regulator